MGPVDLTVFAAYFVAALLIGFWAGRRKKESSRDFFLTSGTLFLGGHRLIHDRGFAQH